MTRSMQRLGISLLVLILLALGVWSTSLWNDERLEPFGNEAHRGPQISGSEPDASGGPEAGSAPIEPSLQYEGDETSEESETPFRVTFETEPVDPDWAPRMAATLDSVIRSLGGPIRDVKVECRSIHCRAEILHYSSLFELDEAGRNDVLKSLLDNFSEEMRPSVESSLGVDWTSGAALGELSPDKRLGSLPPEDAYGTVLNFTRVAPPMSTK